MAAKLKPLWRFMNDPDKMLKLYLRGGATLSVVFFGLAIGHAWWVQHM